MSSFLLRCIYFTYVGKSENEAVSRGAKAVNLVYQLTDRVPALIEQSHLERNEGMLYLAMTLTVHNLT